MTLKARPTAVKQICSPGREQHVIGDELSSGHVLRGAPGDFTTSLPLLLFFLSFLNHVRATSSTQFDESCLVRLDQWEKLKNVFYSMEVGPHHPSHTHVIVATTPRRSSADAAPRRELHRNSSRALCSSSHHLYAASPQSLTKRTFSRAPTPIQIAYSYQCALCSSYY
jgi:hypothetical protein